MKEYLFEKEIRVFSMRRAGNSAVRFFIIGSFPRGVVVALNNTHLSFRIHGPFPKRGKPWYKRRYKHLVNGVEHMSIADISVCLKEEYCYDWERRKWAKFYGKGENGFAKDVYNLVVIRSPHNLLASVLKYPKGKMKYVLTGNERYLEFTELWIQYAEEALSITNYIPDKIVVLFDKLVGDSYYRKSISDALGIPYDYLAISRSHPASGSPSPDSSFDGDKYIGMTHKMKVLDRWEYIVDPREEVWWTIDECREKLFHPKVVEYTKELFDIDLRSLF